MIKLEDVTKIYELGKGNTVTAVRGVTLEIGSGEFTVIVGRSGSGKTTLLNLAAGLTRPTSGRVALDGVDLWNLNDQQQSHLRNRKIGFVFQFPSLLPTLTVHENVILPTIFGSDGHGPDVRERAEALLRRVGLSDKLTAYPRQLSAGQQQRVVIARSLINQPQVLLADEPTSNLDEKTEMEIVDLFRDLHASLGLTIVLVTHTRQLVSSGMRTIEMADGRIVEGSAASVVLGGTPAPKSRARDWKEIMMVNTRFVTRLRVPLSISGQDSAGCVFVALRRSQCGCGDATPNQRQARPKARKSRPRVTWWSRTWGSMRLRLDSCSRREISASG